MIGLALRIAAWSGALLIGALIFYFFWARYLVNRSFDFLGLTHAERAEVERDAGAPLGLIARYALRSMLETHFYSKSGMNDPHVAARELQSLLPTSVSGYILEAFAFRVEENMEEAQATLNDAHALADAFPELNHDLEELIPSIDELRNGQREPCLTERVPGLFWTVDADLRLTPTHYMHLQASIVRLRDGTLVIVNPTDFEAIIVEKIKRLGEVSSLVTSTKAHCLALKKAALIWPRARILGVDKTGNHNEPDIAFDGFLGCDGDDGRKFFGNEIFTLPLKGHHFKECLLYHYDTRALLGLTDLAILNPSKTVSTQDYVSVGMTLYGLSMGLYRGKSHGSPLASQNYHQAFTHDRCLLKASLEHALSLPFRHLTAGHGGYFRGARARKVFREAFQWILDPERLPAASTVVHAFAGVAYALSRGIIGRVIAGKLERAANMNE